MVEREGVTEKLKAENQMLLVVRINNIRNRDCQHRTYLRIKRTGGRE